eukprot:Gb_11646 [translate_table: standard]
MLCIFFILESTICLEHEDGERERKHWPTAKRDLEDPLEAIKRLFELAYDHAKGSANPPPQIHQAQEELKRKPWKHTTLSKNLTWEDNDFGAGRLLMTPSFPKWR